MNIVLVCNYPAEFEARNGAKKRNLVLMTSNVSNYFLISAKSLFVLKCSCD